MNATPDSPQNLEVEFVALPAGGRRLAGRLWRPATGEPVPAIIDASPYRGFDVLRPGQDRLLRALAERGYAVLALDAAGAGGSEGVLADEYLAGEIDDAVAAVGWCAAQPWCSGAVGMNGLSWAGFVALRAAARRPAALKALAIGGVSEDGWVTDIHNLGGAPYAARVDWAATMLAFNALPPDPQQTGEAWRAMWLERLEANRPWIETWLSHPERDSFWTGKAADLSGPDAPDVPLLIYGGLADKYATSALRIASAWRGPVRTILGPWDHAPPDIAGRGPRIGFQAMAADWWDRWLKGRRTGPDLPPLTAWIGEPDRDGGLEAGRWIAAAPPSAQTPRLSLAFEEGATLAPAPKTPERLIPDLYEDAPGPIDLSSRFVALAEPAAEAIDLLGAGVVRARIGRDRAGGQIVARLVDLAPGGAAVRMSVGALNLALAAPGEGPVEVEIPLQAAAWRLKPGHRLALALSAEGWPTLWPAREAAVLTIEPGSLRLEFPLAAEAGAAPPLPPPNLRRGAKVEALKILTPADAEPANLDLPKAAMLESQSLGHHLPETGTDYLWRSRFGLALTGDGQAAAVKTAAIAFERAGWSIRIETRLEVRSTPDAFEIGWRVCAREAGRVVFDRSGEARVPRTVA